MSKNKKIVLVSIALILCLLLLFFSIKIKPLKEKGKPLFEFLNQNLYIQDIESIDYIRYTEGGDNTINYTDEIDIEILYDLLKSMKVGKETNRACEDNTTVYLLHMKNGSEFKVEIECDWLVVGNKRYTVVKD